MPKKIYHYDLKLPPGHFEQFSLISVRTGPLLELLYDTPSLICTSRESEHYLGLIYIAPAVTR